MSDQLRLGNMFVAVLASQDTDVWDGHRGVSDYFFGYRDLADVRGTLGSRDGRMEGLRISRH